MARKNKHEDQPELPFDEPLADSDSSDGVSVSLDERADTIEYAAKIYADYNKLTTGLGKAAKIPEVLSQLEDRYGVASVPGVVAGAKKNSFYSPAGAELDFDNPSMELRMLRGVLKYDELLAAGADPTVLSAELQPQLVGIRRAIGPGVYASERNREVRKVKASAARAKKYGQ